MDDEAESHELDRVLAADPNSLTPIPDMDALTMVNWMNDVAQNIIPYSRIANRYDFATERVMKYYIRDNPEIRRRIKARRAIWEADGNVDVRARALAAYAVLEGIPHTSQVMYDATATSTAKLEALKAHSRIAGLDGMPNASRDGVGPNIAPGGRFSINFIFSDKTENITTIEHDPTPPPTPAQEPSDASS